MEYQLKLAIRKSEECNAVNGLQPDGSRLHGGTSLESTPAESELVSARRTHILWVRHRAFKPICARKVAVAALLLAALAFLLSFAPVKAVTAAAFTGNWYKTDTHVHSTVS